jgi:thioredoxin 1|tara:strand:- start:241 stop:498 length:258 start_codon:yes stop_codon:yes gene_type:complete
MAAQVKFYNAKWCGPCKQMKPHIEKLQKEGYDIQEIDVDEFPSLAEEAEVRGVPTLMIYDNDGMQERVVGYQDYDRLKKRIDIYS